MAVRSEWGGRVDEWVSSWKALGGGDDDDDDDNDDDNDSLE